MSAAAIDPRRPPGWFWVVGVLVALWMLVGVLAWCIDLGMSAERLAQMPAAQQQLYATRPHWVFVVYGVAVFSGFGGAIALLLRRKFAKTLFLLSLLAAVVQFGYTFAAMDALALLGPALAVPLPAMVIAVGLFTVWYARWCARHGLTR
jgi:hypothetical protein